MEIVKMSPSGAIAAMASWASFDRGMSSCGTGKNRPVIGSSTSLGIDALWRAAKRISTVISDFPVR